MVKEPVPPTASIIVRDDDNLGKRALIPSRSDAGLLRNSNSSRQYNASASGISGAARALVFPDIRPRQTKGTSSGQQLKKSSIGVHGKLSKKYTSQKVGNAIDEQQSSVQSYQNNKKLVESLISEIDNKHSVVSIKFDRPSILNESHNHNSRGSIATRDQKLPVSHTKVKSMNTLNVQQDADKLSYPRHLPYYLNPRHPLNAEYRQAQIQSRLADARRSNGGNLVVADGVNDNEEHAGELVLYPELSAAEHKQLADSAKRYTGMDQQQEKQQPDIGNPIDRRAAIDTRTHRRSISS